MLKECGLKKETEALITAAQDQALNTKHHQAQMHECFYMWYRIMVDDLKFHKRWFQSVSVTENVVNKRDEIAISIQSCWSVNALSETNEDIVFKKLIDESVNK